VTVALSAARTEVRALLNEPNAQQWTDAQLNSWINQGAQDVARRAEILWKVQPIPVQENVQNYDWPTDVYRTHRVEFIPQTGTFTYPLSFMGYNEMDQVWGVYQTFPAAWPTWYTLKGQQAAASTPGAPMIITLFPVPAQSGVLNVYYYRTIIPAANDTDLVDTTAGWEDLVYEYAVYKALRNDNNPNWQNAKNEYEEDLNNLIQTTRTWTDEPNSFSSGQAQFPPWAVGGFSDWM